MPGLPLPVLFQLNPYPLCFIPTFYRWGRARQRRAQTWASKALAVKTVLHGDETVPGARIGPEGNVEKATKRGQRWGQGAWEGNRAACVRGSRGLHKQIPPDITQSETQVAL